MQKFFDFRRVLWGVLAGSVIIVSSCVATKSSVTLQSSSAGNCLEFSGSLQTVATRCGTFLGACAVRSP